MPTARTIQKKRRLTANRPVPKTPPVDVMHDVRLTYYVTRDMADALRRRKGPKKISSYLAERERQLQEADLH